MSKRVGAVVDDDLAFHVRFTAERWGISQAEVIRAALEVFTGSEQDQEFVLTGRQVRMDADNA